MNILNTKKFLGQQRENYLPASLQHCKVVADDDDGSYVAVVDTVELDSIQLDTVARHRSAVDLLDAIHEDGQNCSFVVDMALGNTVELVSSEIDRMNERTKKKEKENGNGLIHEGTTRVCCQLV